MKELRFKFFLLILIIAGLLIWVKEAFCGPESSSYETIITLSSTGTTSGSSDTYNIQGLAGQASIGSTTQSNLDLRFGFLPLLELRLPVTQEFEIYDIQAFSFLTGQEILPTTWQKNNDPYFIWKTKIIDPSIIILGYSVSLDSEPDEIIDTTEEYYNGFLDPPIIDGKHTFYVKAATTGGVWGELVSFEFWVDTKEPEAENLEPMAGSITKDNTPTISLDLSDTLSGVDLDTIKLFIDDEALSFTYEQGHLTSTPIAPLADGSQTARIQAEDFAGNLLNMVWGFIVDANIPIGSIIINGGEESTTYARVRLNLEASDETTEVTHMILSNDGIFDSESWENFQTLVTDWILDEPQRIGLKSVYCMFKDEAGNISSVYQDDIRLISAAIDTIITSGPYSPTQNTSAQFNYQSTFEDAVFSYKLDIGEWSEWSPSTSISFSSLSLGNHIFSVKSAKDLNGDEIITEEEQDPLPAQWTWVITTEQEPKKGERILYWRTE